MIELFDHQKKAVKKGTQILSKFGMVYLAMEVRTGKTLTALSILQDINCRHALFITTKKAIGSILQDYQSLNPTYKLSVINYESVHKCNEKYDAIVIDEAHKLGAFPKPSMRTVRIKNLVQSLPVIYLSGTPSPESYSQLFHQLWVSKWSPFKQYRSFYKWARDFVEVYQIKVNGMPVNQYDRADYTKIKEKINHLFVNVTQEEAKIEKFVDDVILPVRTPQLIIDLMAVLRKDKVTSYEGSDIVADTPAKMLQKMHQMSSGTIKDENGSVHIISDFKAQFIKENFEGYKIAILYKFIGEGVILKDLFPNWTDDPQEFNKSEDMTFIAQVSTAREGVNLSTADAIVMYNIDFSATSYWQSRDRMTNYFRKKDNRVYWIFGDKGIEGEVYRAVQKKKSFTVEYYKNHVPSKSPIK